MTSLAELIDRVAHPERPHVAAFLASGRGGVRVRMDRGTFGARVRGAAGAFVRAGMPAGSAIGFGVRQDVAGIAWLLGALRAGLTVVVLDPGLTPERLAAQCRVAAVESVVLDGGIASVAAQPLLRSAARRLGLRVPDPDALAPTAWATSLSLAGLPRLDRLMAGDGVRETRPDAPAVVLFTSGTTDEPRGVVHTPASLAATMEMASAAVPLTPEDRVLGAGLHVVAPALLAGAPILLPTDRGGIRALARATRQVDVTHVSLPLHRAIQWAAAGGAGSSLRSLVLGSAPVRNAGLAALAGRLPAATELASMYGLTEHMLVARVSAAERLAHDERDGDLVGEPLPGVRVRVAGDGEVRVAGPGLARGYLGTPPGQGLGATPPADELPTGDLGRVDAAGRLVLLGRRKEMVIRDGVNVYPALYEAPLAAAAGLEAAFLVGIPQASGNERLALVGVPRRGDPPDVARRRLEAVVAGSHSPLDAHARPDAVVVMDSIPRSGRSGKPDRAAMSRRASRAMGIETA